MEDNILSQGTVGVEAETLTAAPKETEAEEQAMAEARAFELKAANFESSAVWQRLRGLIEADIDNFDKCEEVNQLDSAENIAINFKASKRIAEKLKGYIAQIEIWAGENDG